MSYKKVNIYHHNSLFYTFFNTAFLRLLKAYSPEQVESEQKDIIIASLKAEIYEIKKKN